MDRERDIFAEAADRTARREPFAIATVVRAERPTSAKPGAKAIVDRDGALRGWIGGSCAAPTVVREALASLADGEPRLIALSSGPEPARDGVRHFAMTCHSGGTLEIYIEPILPAEQLVVIGRAPVGRALAALGAMLGRHVVVVDPDADPADVPTADLVVADLAAAGVDERSAVVVATRGEYDEDAVRETLRTPARYVALVASRTRAAVLIEALRDAGVPADALARLRFPAGLDIGARTEEEIALSIHAEIVATRSAAKTAGIGDAPAAGVASLPEVGAPPSGARAHAPARATALVTGAARLTATEAIDPICGMTVAITPHALRGEHEGTTYYFCVESCRRTFLRDPAAALASSA